MPIDRSKLETRNLKLILSAIFVMTTTAFAQQPLATPQAITDAAKLESKTVADMQPFSIEKLYMTRQIGSSAWSPDGKQIAFISNISGRNNLWLVPSSGGWPTQLTISDQRQAQPAWSPDGNWIAYISDHDGDEQWDIFLVSPKSGEVTNLTISPESAERVPVWSPDGKQLAYLTKPKTGSSYEVDLIDIATHHVRHVSKDTPKELSNHAPVFSRDGKLLVYTQEHATGKDGNIFIVDLASGQSTNLTPHERQSWIKLAKDYGYEVHAVFFDVPVEVCLERNRRRERVVAEDVMRRMAAKLRPPTFEEGFAKITLVRVKQKD